MPDKKVDLEELEALGKLDLLAILEASDCKEEEKQKFLKSFSELTWTLFFQSYAKDLSKKDQTAIENFIKEKDFENLERYFEEKEPNARLKLSTKALVAKKIIIVNALDYKITLIKARAKVKKQEDNSEKLIQLQELAYNDKWQKFTKLFHSIKENG